MDLMVTWIPQKGCFTFKRGHFGVNFSMVFLVNDMKIVFQVVESSFGLEDVSFKQGSLAWLRFSVS